MREPEKSSPATRPAGRIAMRAVRREWQAPGSSAPPHRKQAGRPEIKNQRHQHIDQHGGDGWADRAGRRGRHHQPHDVDGERSPKRGSTDRMGAIIAPAKAASMVPNPNTIMKSRRISTPRADTIRALVAPARTSMPTRVRLTSK